jgi:hypothetical protein
MIKAFVFKFCFVILIISCNQTEETNNRELNKKTIDFDISKLKIKKGHIGNITVGMTVTEAEKHLNGLIKKESLSTDFGFGGGGPAYLYYLDNQLILSIIPKLGNDTIHAIIAIHKNLKTYNGLSPKTSVENILITYPNHQVEKDLMNDWEFMKDTQNNWTFVFFTNENNEIGKYIDITLPSKPYNILIESDWITIE